MIVADEFVDGLRAFGMLSEQRPLLVRVQSKRREMIAGGVCPSIQQDRGEADRS
jgi:hypothetical protein